MLEGACIWNTDGICVLLQNHKIRWIRRDTQRPSSSTPSPARRKEETEVECRSIYWDFRALSSWTKWVRCTLEFQKLSWRVVAASCPTCKGQVSTKTMWSCRKNHRHSHVASSRRKGRKGWSYTWMWFVFVNMTLTRRDLIKEPPFQMARPLLLNNPHPKAELPYANTTFTPQKSFSSNREWWEGIPPHAAKAWFSWKVTNSTNFSGLTDVTEIRGGARWHGTGLELSPPPWARFGPVKLPPQCHQLHKKRSSRRVWERLERLSWEERRVGHLTFEEAEPQSGTGAFTSGAVWGVMNGGSF